MHGRDAALFVYYIMLWTKWEERCARINRLDIKHFHYLRYIPRREKEKESSSPLGEKIPDL